MVEGSQLSDGEITNSKSLVTSTRAQDVSET